MNETCCIYLKVEEVLFVSKVLRRIKEIFRVIENINKRIINIISLILFLNTCIRNNINTISYDAKRKFRILEKTSSSFLSDESLLLKKEF